MKKSFTKVLAFILTLVMVAGALPFASFAAAAPMTIAVSSARALPGSTVDVTISLTDNPGVTSVAMDVYFDQVLTLESVSFGDELRMNGQTIASQNLASPVALSWINGMANYAEDVTFATLRFNVSANAAENTEANVTVVFEQENIFNVSEQNVPCVVENGVVTIIPAVAGDINGDLNVNNKDVTRLMQYLAHWDVTVNAAAIDVNGDTNVNNKDVSRLMQYLARWDVGIYLDGVEYRMCVHEMTAVSAQAPTCTENGNIAYWYCTKCQKYFKDQSGLIQTTLENTVVPAEGHTIVIDPYVAPTYESAGLTEGKHCGVCGLVILAQQTIPPLQMDQYSIEYYIYGNDEYLAGLSIDNPNQTSYTSETGVPWLDDLVVPGYNFEGWYDGQGSAASRVISIPAGTARNIKLYAKWTKQVYTITFDNSSMDLSTSTMDYTVDQRVTLDKPTVDRYVFLGWTTDSDELISEIKPGTTGNFTLHSNWTSKRNLSKPVASLGNPIIVEDTIEGKILFTYEIGQIENVPLYTIKNLPSAGGVVSVYTETVKKSIGTTDASTVAKAIDHITTDSTSWTLSEDWNETTHVEDSVLEEHGYDRTTGQSVGKTSSNTFTLTTNEYDNTVVKTNDGSVATTTQYNTNEVDSRATWESKASLSVSDTESTKYTDSAYMNAEMGFDAGVANGKVGAGMETSTEISSSSTAGASAETTIAHENTSHSKTGTDTVTVTDNTTATTTDKGWNKSSSSASTSSTSLTRYEEETLSERIATEKTYGQSYAKGGSNSSSADWSTSTGESDTYSSTFTYFNSEETTEGVSYTINGESDGSYRLVRAGIVHVFAVVIYDIANAQYGVTTYSVLDDDTYTYIDYSATSAAKFDDNENGVLPFEVPYFVNDYVNGRIAATEGLVYNEATLSTGEYVGSNTCVIIPEFFSLDNQDNTTSAYTVRHLSAETFSGNEELKGVMLSNYIREIPDNAFAGCTSLQFVYGSEISYIGNNAFNGCIDLGQFKVSSTVEFIGEDAFSGVDSIVVTASSQDVVIGAINSGAKRITINISAIAEDMSNVTLVIPDTIEYFELQGGRNSFSGLKIKSNAETTVLNGITITDSTGIPLEISSEEVTFNQVFVESPSYVLLLKGNAPTVSLYGTSKLVSSSNNAVVCRNTTFDRISTTVTSKLEITGNLLAYGTPNNASSCITFAERGEIVLLTAAQYEQYIRGSYEIIFDANEGTVDTDSKIAYVGSAVGALPDPNRDYYTFAGWYTDPTDGELVTAASVFNSAENITLYAHWTENPVYGWVEYSDIPEDAQIVSSKTQYRYRDRERVKTYGSWGSWSAWAPGSASNNETTDVQTATVYGYYYYTCPYCGAHMWGYNQSCFTWAGGCGNYFSAQNWHELWTTTSHGSTSDPYQTGKAFYDDSTYGRLFVWSNGSSRAGYRYRTRSINYVWSDYGPWSVWSDTSYTTSDSRQVETKQVYRYINK